MNKTHAALTIATLTIAGLALGGCAQHDATPSAQKTVVSHPSYAESFASLDAMSKSADIIVHGTITATAPGEPLGDIVTSTYTFKVDNWIKGTPTSNNEVTVFQTGGIKGDTTYVTEDDPLMHVGEEAVLYLDEGDPGIFHTVAGPTGRLEVTDGQVKKLAGSSITIPIPSTLKSVEAATQTAMR
jgi:hypothetical protein